MQRDNNFVSTFFGHRNDTENWKITNNILGFSVYFKLSYKKKKIPKCCTSF